MSTRDTESKPQRQFDVRTVERNIKKGNVTRKDYEKYLKSLPDVAEKVAPPEEEPRDLAAAADDDDDIDDDDDETDTDEPETDEPAPA